MAGREQAYTSIEICAGAGGQAVGLHQAGFSHRALIEIDPHACETLRRNTARERWGDPDRLVLRENLTEYGGPELLSDGYAEPGELDLLAGGVPCPPFSLAGKRLGQDDERDLFPAMIDMVRTLRPRAVMIENVRGLLEPPEKFGAYRRQIEAEIESLGYRIIGWEVMEAKDFGVPQLRPRAILVALRHDVAPYYKPISAVGGEVSAFSALEDTMRERFYHERAGLDEATATQLFERWKSAASEKNTVAPTLVGGSKKHGGADLGPSRAKKAWAELGVDGHGVANDMGELADVERDLVGTRGPKLTVQQAAIIQGFPRDWVFTGGKTARYRQVGNAFPPPVAQAVGSGIAAALRAADTDRKPGTEVAEGKRARPGITDRSSGTAAGIAGGPSAAKPPVGADGSEQLAVV